ncbi:MAG: alpha/beta hydrolase [Rhodovarius sp.]|nr:alpha/beta hydrolase [Rhodovarius sp.]
MTEVVFLTNRALQGPPESPDSYQAQPGSVLLSGRAVVGPPQGLGSGKIIRLMPAGVPGIGPAEESVIRAAPHLLLFIHGFANPFADAIARAAFLADWFGREGGVAAAMRVVVFTWPSHGKLVGPAARTGKKPGPTAAATAAQFPLTGAYKADQARARASATALLSAIDRLRAALGPPRPGRRVFLMAHSMGNELLAVALAHAAAPAVRIFDEIFLIAADTDAVKGDQPPPWLATARRIGGRLHILHSSNDSVLLTSALPVVNGRERLGFLGRAGFPPGTPGLRWLDCSATLEEDRDPVEGNPNHWYYRRVPRVRADIAAMMNGKAGEGVVVLPPPPAHPAPQPPGPGA